MEPVHCRSTNGSLTYINVCIHSTTQTHTLTTLHTCPAVFNSDVRRRFCLPVFHWVDSLHFSPRVYVDFDSFSGKRNTGNTRAHVEPYATNFCILKGMHLLLDKVQLYIIFQLS